MAVEEDESLVHQSGKSGAAAGNAKARIVDGGGAVTARRAIRPSAARYISGSAEPWMSTPPSRWVIAGSGFSFTSCLSRYAASGHLKAL